MLLKQRTNALLFCGAQLEQHAMDFVLGGRRILIWKTMYGQKLIKWAFAVTHYKKMYDYGNRLGAG